MMLRLAATAVLLLTHAGTPLARASPPASDARADAGQPSPRFKWDLPPVLTEVDVPGSMAVDGVPVRMRGVLVRGRSEDLLRFFETSFRRQGLWVQAPARQLQLLQEPQLTGFHPDTETSYTVILQDNRDGTTTLILGEAAIGLATGRGPDSDFVPLPGRAEQVVRTSGEGTRSLAFVARGTTPADIHAFYRERLARAGYAVEGDELVRGSDRIRIITSAERAGVRVLVTRSTGRRGTPP